jgi:hypothetical protein
VLFDVALFVLERYHPDDSGSPAVLAGAQLTEAMSMPRGRGLHPDQAGVTVASRVS